MRKRNHREVKVLLGGFARLVGFLRTLLGFKVASLPKDEDWLQLNFSFSTDYFVEGVELVEARGSPPIKCLAGGHPARVNSKLENDQ